MTHVLFTVPSFMGGGLPVSGVVKKDITLVGTDDVTVIVKANTDTMYSDTTRVFDSISSNTRILYQFIFPLNTLVSSDTTRYTTPKKSVYVFSDGSSTMKIENQITKNVTTGTIDITPPSVIHQGSFAQDSFGQGSFTQDSFGTMDNEQKNNVVKDWPFNALGLILYKLVMDMIPIFIFWFLFVSISCWLVVESNDLYPYDVSNYPFVFYKKGVPIFNLFKSKQSEDALCTLIPDETITKLVENQTTKFEKLRIKPDEYKRRLSIIQSSALKMDEDNVNKFSKLLMEKCEKPEKCTMDYLLYFLGKILLNNFVYCNMVLAFIHSAAYEFNDKVVTKIPSPISIITFAAVLYFLFLGVGAMNKQVIQKLGIQLQKETTINTLLLNQFYYLLISILSCCLCLLLPLCSILMITSLMATAYTLGSTVLFPFNATLGIVALITLLVSFGQYIIIILNLSKGMNQLDLIEYLYVKKFGILTFFSMIGITLPILMGFFYGMYLGGNIFFTFFQFLKIPDVVQRLKTSSASIVLLALVLFLLHVKDIIGNTYAMMTFMIIVLIGMYVMTKTG